MTILDKIQKTIQDFGLVDKNQTILSAVSGGADSVVLVHALDRLGYIQEIAHVNYKLRGKESDQDETFVTALGEELGIKVHRSMLPIDPKKSGIQNLAREKRYDWFQQLSRERRIDRIALGHNANDNFETALFHLIKGEGIMNQRGISVETGIVIRPLLFITREEIKAFALENGIRWREDKTNSENKYSRNLLRNEVIPLLRKINPSLEKTYGRDYLRELDRQEILFSQLDKNPAWYEEGDEKGLIHLAPLMSQPGWILRLEFMLREFQYTSEMRAELAKLIKAESGKKLAFGEWELIKDRETLILTKTKDDTSEESLFIHSIPFEGKFNDQKISLKEVGEVPKDLKNLEAIEYFDPVSLDAPLSIRKWKPGDHFTPLGMKGDKKISDFLIDEKVPIDEKSGILVLESGVRIAAVLGMRISEHFKIINPDGPGIELRVRDLNQQRESSEL